jgi:hypothetical protein
MSDAGHEPALPIGKVETGDRELDEIADAYLSQAGGDAVRALPTASPGSRRSTGRRSISTRCSIS